MRIKGRQPERNRSRTTSFAGTTNRLFAARALAHEDVSSEYDGLTEEWLVLFGQKQEWLLKSNELKMSLVAHEVNSLGVSTQHPPALKRYRASSQTR